MGSFAHKITKRNFKLYGNSQVSPFTLQQKSIIVRPFETSQLLEQSLIENFANCVDVKITVKFEIPKRRRNLGLSPVLAEIMGILSIYNYSVDAITPHLKSEDKVNNQLFNHGEQYDFLSPNERAAILERYTVGNQWIAREFLGRRNGILFQEALPDTSKPWKKFRLEKEEVIKLFADADFLEEKQRAIFQEQVLYALAHPVMINLKLFQGKIRKTIKKTGQEYTTYI